MGGEGLDSWAIRWVNSTVCEILPESQTGEQNTPRPALLAPRRDGFLVMEEVACPLRCIVPATDAAEGFGSAAGLRCSSPNEPIASQMDFEDAGDKQLEGSDGEAPELDLRVEKRTLVFCRG